jgi:hypothetical protein
MQSEIPVAVCLRQATAKEEKEKEKKQENRYT